MKEKSMSFAQRTELKMELSVNQPLSFSQIYDLEKVKRQVKILWRENKQLYDYLEKARLYSLLVQKPELWEKWYEKEKYSIGFPKIDELFKQLSYKLCAFCQNPFSSAHRDRMYCSDRCKLIVWKRKNGIE